MVIRAQTLRKVIFLKFSFFITKRIKFGFQQALDHLQAIIFSQDMDFIPIFAGHTVQSYSSYLAFETVFFSPIDENMQSAGIENSKFIPSFSI